jgi:hypothetical protein
VTEWLEWVESAGVRVVGEPVEWLTRPWSTVWTVETADGTLWFKQNCPPQRAEAGVHAAVARLAPEYVEAPVAVDVEKGWLLTRDGGSTVAGDSGTMASVVRDCAALQRRTLGHRDELVAAGLAMAEPLDAPGVARGQAIELAALPAGDPRHITPQQRDSVLAALPALEHAAMTLHNGPVPLALDQCDLFPRNVFLPRPGAAHHRFFDFADAAWAHPFGSLLLLVASRRRRGEPTRALVDAYLSGWTDFAPLDELRALAVHALRLAPLHRSTAWFKILSTADQPALEKHGRTPWSWLEDVTAEVTVQ